MTKWKIIPYITILVLLSSGCSYRDLKEPQKISGSTQYTGANLSFAQIQASVLAPKCARCHGWVNSYEAVKGLSGEIQARVESQDPNFLMPPTNAAPLSAEEKSLLLSWLASGAPRDSTNAPTPNPPAPVVPEPPVVPPPSLPRLSFSNVSAQVFQPKCARCHSGMLSSYESVVANLTQIESRVRSTLDFEKMPPPRAAQLTQEEFLLLTDWIKAGAPKGDQNSPNPPTNPTPTPPPCEDDLRGKKGDDDCQITI
jgi:uncharacterized membrane protein